MHVLVSFLSVRCSPIIMSDSPLAYCLLLAEKHGLDIDSFVTDVGQNLSQNLSHASTLENATPTAQNVSGEYPDHANITTGNPLVTAIKSYVTPGVCIFGIMGNILNLLVLTRRRIQKTMDCSMERSAHMGLIALAISDMSYCISALPTAFLGAVQSVYTEKGFLYFIQRYGLCFTNIFMHTSTWLTLVMAVGRYAAICRPLQARYLVGLNASRISIIATFVLWSLLELPMFWKYDVYEMKCPTVNAEEYIYFYILMPGPFPTNQRLKQAFTYLWSITGFFLPLIVLAYCNVHLVKALRESSRIRQLYRVNANRATHGSRITPTLVAIVCMFLVLVTPSEILHFYYYAVKGEAYETMNIAIVLTNLLQTANFAFNFVLYCLVNTHFRDAWKDLVYCKSCRRQYYNRVKRRSTGTSTLHNHVTKATIMAQSSFETVI